jgi:hypothetical protein
MHKSVLLMLGIGLCACAQGAEDELFRAQWRDSGHDFANSRSQPAEVRISPANVGSLTVKWIFTTGGDISATPTVAGDAVFFPDWSGNLFAVNKHTGRSFASGGTVIDGPAIVDGVVYWGSGYSNTGTSNNKLYAFSLPKK